MNTNIIQFEKGVEKATEIIKSGGVVACSTDTVYGLSCDPFCADAVDMVYKLKGREKNVPLLIVADKNYDISDLVYVDQNTKKYLDKYWPCSVTFIFKIKDKRLLMLSCGKDTIAIRKPADKNLEMLLQKCLLLTSTSANISGQAPATNAQQAKQYFDSKIAIVLDGGESKALSSTIVDVSGGDIRVLRQGEVVVKNL